MPNLDLEQLKHASTSLPVEDLIQRRWSPRAYAEKAVAEEDLKTLFTAASWAASSYNEQPWRFILGRRGDETYGKLFNSLAPPNQAWAGAAPILYATAAKKTFTSSGQPNGVALHDVGAASATLSLQAAALGLHTHGMAGFDKETLRAFFAIPSDFDPVAILALGYLGDPETLHGDYKQQELKPRQRKPLSEIVFDHWAQPARL